MDNINSSLTQKMRRDLKNTERERETLWLFLRPNGHLYNMHFQFHQFIDFFGQTPIYRIYLDIKLCFFQDKCEEISLSKKSR